MQLTYLIHHEERFGEEAAFVLITLVNMFLVFGQHMLLQVSFVSAFEFAELAFEWFLRDMTISHMTGESRRRRTCHVAQ